MLAIWQIFFGIPDRPGATAVGCNRIRLTHKELRDLVIEKANAFARNWNRFVSSQSQYLMPLIRIFESRLENIESSRREDRSLSIRCNTYFELPVRVFPTV